MRKLLLVLFAALIAAPQLMAQKDGKPRRTYLNVGFVQQKIKAADFNDAELAKTNFGANLTIGRTFFLHKNPLLGMIRIGLDATFADFNYGNYKNYDEDEGEVVTGHSHQAEFGLGVGPSVTVTPIEKVNIQAYFRFNPSYSAIYEGDFGYGAFLPAFTTGGSVWWNFIGVGLEGRFGSAKYEKKWGDGEIEEAYLHNAKLKTGGVRAYVTFRF